MDTNKADLILLLAFSQNFDLLIVNLELIKTELVIH